MFQKHLQKASDSVVGGTLYVVATPIGNLADITLRALAVLQAADVVCAEDTRVTAQLLSAYGIQGKLVSVREHNERQMADKIVGCLSDGMVVAQVSDYAPKPQTGRGRGRCRARLSPIPRLYVAWAQLALRLRRNRPYCQKRQHDSVC